MRFALTILLVFSGVLYAGPTEPVALKDGTAQNRRYEVVLEADKDTPRFGTYELKGDDSAFPAILVRELPNGRVVGRLSWPGDPTGGDEQPLRSHTEVLWSPTSEAVAINTDERFYSYSSILVRQPKSGKFVEMKFPDYKTFTGFPPPKRDQLRARGFTHALRWTAEGDLVCGIGYSPEASYEGTDPNGIKIRSVNSGCWWTFLAGFFGGDSRRDVVV